MRKTAPWALALSFALLLAGCAHQPYVASAAWLMHDNAVPRYFADYDVFFIHRAEAGWEADRDRHVKLYDDLKQHFSTVYGRKVRFFAPLLHDDTAVEEAEKALSYYHDVYHGGEHAYIVIVSGRDPAFLAAFERECRALLTRESGCARVAYEPAPDYVATAEDVATAAHEVEALAYERRWRRPRPIVEDAAPAGERGEAKSE